MNSLVRMYSRSFFKIRSKLLWRAPIVCDVVEKTFELKPGNTIIDVGCATGEYVKEFEKRGYTALGIEGSSMASQYALVPLLIMDLRLPITWKDKCTLCMCLEVAEHIEPEYTDIFVENLTKFSDTILVSAAEPFQKGHNHFNCQPKEYWEEKFDYHRYRRNNECELKFQSGLLPFKKKELSLYMRNSMVFERQKGE